MLLLEAGRMPLLLVSWPDMTTPSVNLPYWFEDVAEFSVIRIVLDEVAFTSGLIKGTSARKRVKAPNV